MAIYYSVRARKNPLTGSVNYYADIATRGTMTYDNVAEEIEKITSLSDGDVRNVLASLEYVVKQALKNSMTVRLGTLGSFRPTITSDPSATAADVTASNILRVRVRFTPSGKLVGELTTNRVTFTQQTADSTTADDDATA